AELVSRYTGSAVVDKTAIEGVYDFALRWLPEEQTANTVDPAPFLATALQDVLGLRLQPQKVPVDVIVVDKVERAPVVE
ncbi:MAG TPA: TIGR03435 family protein, partial [Candidatus Sulfopaludibacter sp.]|nr:TIGR03435 family protein [Candidatus Sulfopaludibacter sp.]